MRYRTFGAIDFEPSALGFGAMRLPLLAPDAHDGSGKRGKGDNDPQAGPARRRIDERQATDMLRRAVEAGVNYVDTAYVYHDGESEAWLGRALRQVAADLLGPGSAGLAALRRRVKVATKLPVWQAEHRDDVERLFSEQLERLQLDSIDFYLLHSLDAGSVAKLRELDVFGWAERALADGRIGHLGFSFHDEYPAFEELVDATDLWEFCQIQYNYMDEDYQAGTRGLEYASATRIRDRRRGAVTEYLVEVRARALRCPSAPRACAACEQAFDALARLQWDDGAEPTWEPEDRISDEVMREYLDRVQPKKQRNSRASSDKGSALVTASA